MSCTHNADAASCTCTYACPRHGHCCACIAHHNAKGEVPGCLFTKEGEARWDRSLAAFLEDRQGH